MKRPRPVCQPPQEKSGMEFSNGLVASQRTKILHQVLIECLSKREEFSMSVFQFNERLSTTPNDRHVAVGVQRLTSELFHLIQGVDRSEGVV